MKKLIAALFLTLSVSAMAGPVFLTPRCTTYNGECQLINTSGKDVSCMIRVDARTMSGRNLNNTEYKVLYAGMFSWTRVFNNDLNDRISYISGNANCNTLR